MAVKETVDVRASDMCLVTTTLIVDLGRSFTVAPRRISRFVAVAEIKRKSAAEIRDVFWMKMRKISSTRRRLGFISNFRVWIRQTNLRNAA
jgi:hypothetical protein